MNEKDGELGGRVMKRWGGIVMMKRHGTDGETKGIHGEQKGAETDG